MKKLWFSKMVGICLCVCAGLFLFTPYLQAATPTYIQLEFSDIDYDEAQYIKFIIDADEDFKIVLYMKDNDNNTFYVTYQTDNEDTGDLDKDDNKELIIYLDEDEYVTGHDETFDSFTHGNSLSFDDYINNQWEEQEYEGGSAELEKIRIFGNEFYLYYIAIDNGDFEDPTWEFDPNGYNPKGTGSKKFKDDGSQTYNNYGGGYPSISPSWPPPGMAYNPLSGSFYIPGQDNPGEYPWGY